MKWAVLSDVHGNWEALQAVMTHLRSQGVERIAFLGDAVGYGANPNECLKLLREGTERMVAGNHDWGAIDRTDITYFNPAAQAAILWTAEHLTEENRIFLRDLPLLHQYHGMTFVHASPYQPPAWHYIFTLEEAAAGFAELAGDIAFVGHSHYPLILAQRPDGQVKLVPGSRMTREKGVRYIINVGSVGQPRDRHPDAAYGIYDEDSQEYQLQRIPYDIPLAQKKILKAGLPSTLANRLAQGV